jgi:hypothetical protein
MANINVVKKTPGKYLAYRVSGTEKIVLGDDDLTIKLSSRERDEEVTLDITLDNDQGLMMGTGGNAKSYVAQVIIPARQYEEQEQEGVIGYDEENGQVKGTVKVRVPLPFDISRCTLVLWGMEE